MNMKNDKLTVIQKNKWIQEYQKQLKSLNFYDLLLFKTIVSKIQSKDSLFKESYTISYRELDIAGYPEKYRYRELNKSLENLSSKIIAIKTTKGIRHSGIIKNDWFYPKRAKEVKIQIYEHMADHLLNIKEQFTRYPLNILNKLLNKYDIILFEYFSSIKNFGTQRIKLTTLRELLGLKQEYKRAAVLKQELLNKSLKRINDNTNIHVSYSDIKEGKKITGFIFTIESTKSIMQRETLTESQREIDYRERKNIREKSLGTEILYDYDYYTITAAADHENLVTLTAQRDGIKIKMTVDYRTLKNMIA